MVFPRRRDVGLDRAEPDPLEQLPGVHERLGSSEPAHHRVGRHLGADRGTDPGGPGERGHEDRHRSHAVRDHLHVGRARHPPHLVDRGGPVDGRDVVERERRARRREVAAPPGIEQPHVVPVRDEVLGQVGVDGVGDERRRRHAEPGREQHGTLRPALVAGEPQERVGARFVAPVRPRRAVGDFCGAARRTSRPWCAPPPGRTRVRRRCRRTTP